MDLGLVVSVYFTSSSEHLSTQLLTLDISVSKKKTLNKKRPGMGREDSQ